MFNTLNASQQFAHVIAQAHAHINAQALNLDHADDDTLLKIIASINGEYAEFVLQLDDVAYWQLIETIFAMHHLQFANFALSN